MMKLKTLLSDLLLLALLGAIALGVYRFTQSQSEGRPAVMRYQENDQYSQFDESEGTGSHIDDCQRYLNTNAFQGCVEKRKARMREQGQ